jgi:hypothetical protein
MAPIDPNQATTLIMQATSPTPVRMRLIDGDRAWETIARWARTATGWRLIVDLPSVEPAEDPMPTGDAFIDVYNTPGLDSP